MLKLPSASWCASKPIWPFNVGVIVAGPFLLRDVSEAASAYPRWAGPLELIPTVIWLLFGISIVGLIFVHVARSKTKDGYRQLKIRAARAQELEDTIAENISEIINGIIAGFENQLKLKPDDNSRISLYVDDASGQLVSIGRVATNPNHRSISRKFLPMNEGCVGKAWAEGWAFEADFGEDEYNEHPSHYGMAAEVIEKLAMSPRYLAALRIDDGPRSLAVIVFESQQPHRFDEVKIRREMNAFSSYLTGTLETLSPHLPKSLSDDGEEL